MNIDRGLDHFVLQACGDVICSKCDEVVRSTPEEAFLGEVVSDAYAHTCKPKCRAEHWDPYDGTYWCVQTPGHSGEHEDNDGHWWPTDDQLRTW